MATRTVEINAVRPGVAGLVARISYDDMEARADLKAHGYSWSGGSRAWVRPLAMADRKLELERLTALGYGYAVTLSDSGLAGYRLQLAGIDLETAPLVTADSTALTSDQRARYVAQAAEYGSPAAKARREAAAAAAADWARKAGGR